MHSQFFRLHFPLLNGLDQTDSTGNAVDTAW